jgi:hypothetical protein
MLNKIPQLEITLDDEFWKSFLIPFQEKRS